MLDNEEFEANLECIGLDRAIVACGFYGDLFVHWDDKGNWVEYDQHKRIVDSYKGELDRLRAIIKATEDKILGATGLTDGLDELIDFYYEFKIGD